MKKKKSFKFKPKPAARKAPSQPKPAAAAVTAASQPERKTLDTIRIDAMEYRIECRLDSIERRIDLIGDDLRGIYYFLGQLEERSDEPLRWLDLDRAPDAEKTETQ
jgi:hypothetical protein